MINPDDVEIQSQVQRELNHEMQIYKLLSDAINRLRAVKIGQPYKKKINDIVFAIGLIDQAMEQSGFVRESAKNAFKHLAKIRPAFKNTLTATRRGKTRKYDIYTHVLDDEKKVLYETIKIKHRLRSARLILRGILNDPPPYSPLDENILFVDRIISESLKSIEGTLLIERRAEAYLKMLEERENKTKQILEIVGQISDVAKSKSTIRKGHKIKQLAQQLEALVTT